MNWELRSISIGEDGLELVFFNRDTERIETEDVAL